MLLANLRPYVADKVLKMVTLTVATDGLSLTESLDLLLPSFAKLRRTKLWKKHVTGGCSFLEVKRSSSSPRWHPHLHVLVESSFIPHTQLKATWHAITKTSYVVDIRAVTDPRRVDQYVTKYVTKPTALNYTNHPHLLDETIVSLRSIHSIRPFGTWHKLKLTSTPPPGDWEPVAPLYEILERADRLDPWALKILDQLRRFPPCHSDPAKQPRGQPRSAFHTPPTVPSAVTN